MLSKKLLAAGFGVFSGVMLSAGSAHAVDIADTLFIGELNQWSDNSGESINVDNSVNGSPAGVLDIGDTLRGTLDIGTIEDLSGGGGTTQYGTAGVNELSAIFEVEVVALTVTIDPNNSCGGVASCAGGTLDGDETVDYVFGPNAAFIAEFGLSATTMAVAFEDITPDYDRTGTIANAELTATDGTTVLEIGIGSDPDDFWASIDTPSNVASIQTVPAGQEVGEFNFGLSILFNTLFSDFTQVPTLGGGFVDINGSGSIKGTGGASTGYDAFNNVDLTFRPVVQVPEPGTLGTLGLGLLGLGFLLRTRQQKRAN